MSFQLLDIAVYNSEGDQRVVSFKPGKVNIITGGSRTGKTALIYIVDYCLGRNTCAVPSGVIKDTVAWYVIRIQADDLQIVIGRPTPPQGQASIVDAYLEIAGELDLPEFLELKKNTNTTALRAFLTETIGVTPNEHVPPEGHSRPSLTANFGHTTFYLFQPQDYIAKRNILFYRQDEEQLANTFRDTLPYLLGTAGDAQYENFQKLRRLKRKVAILQKRISEEESLRGHDNSRAASLFAEAVNMGLLSGDMPDEFDELSDALRELMKWEPETPSYEGESTLEGLQDEREKLRTRAKILESEIEAAKAFALRQRGFSDEVIEQKNRLQSVGLYKRSKREGHKCPLCEGEIDGSLPTVENLVKSLANIEKQMDAVVKQRPRLDAYILDRQEKLESLKETLAENKAAIEAVYSQQDVLRENRSRQATQARTVGRISLFLDSLGDTTGDDDQLSSQLESLQAEVGQLEKLLADDAANERLHAALRIIGGQMTQWAQKLELEFSDCPLEFDLTTLTVIAYRDSGKIRLLDMGSAENWLGYHLVTHFALHNWFVEKDRPVPNFLMLDQPTQVYYPSDPPDDGSLEDLEDEDREKVHHLFEFIFEVVKSLHPNFQVIITDHANLRDDWFQEAIVDEWWHGVKFIPEEWYED